MVSTIYWIISTTLGFWIKWTQIWRVVLDPSNHLKQKSQNTYICTYPLIVISLYKAVQPLTCLQQNKFYKNEVLAKLILSLIFFSHKWKLIWITALLLGSRFVIKCTNRIIFLLYNCIQKFRNTKYVFWRLKMNILLSKNLELHLKILL